MTPAARPPCANSDDCPDCKGFGRDHDGTPCDRCVPHKWETRYAFDNGYVDVCVLCLKTEKRY